jgi:hypothetical protein
MVQSDQPVRAARLVPAERLAHNPAETSSGVLLRITRAWTTEDGWPNGV